MQSQHTTLPPREKDTDRAFMTLLLDSLRPLAVAEIKQKMDDPIAAVDGIARLVAVGLAHRLGDFVFASRAAICAEAMG